MKLTTNSKILVTVDEVLQDILVVSYAFESKLFQGVLLDSTKKYLPCRIPNTISPLSSPKTEGSEEDKLYFSIRQRFTYFQEKPVQVNHFHIQKNPKVAGKCKNQKMTVRLRPRQVLCSKCKSICNENSENVNYSTRSKKPMDPPDQSPRQLLSENRRDNHPASSPPAKLTLIPKLSRLQPNEITNAMKGNNIINQPISRAEEEYWIKPAEVLDSNEVKIENCETADKQMVLRKKRSVGSMEDLWDETVFEEGAKKAKTTPVIKISFGTQGEGTVLKIPAKVQTCSESETDEKQRTLSASKAAKKALKKAKKEARRKILAAASPARSIGGASPAYDALQYRKHRHKVKHKKKHKAEKGTVETIKERCLKQKLSINLKRLTSTTYEKAEEDSDSCESSQSGDEVSENPSADLPDDQETITPSPTVEDNKVAVYNKDIVWGKIHGFPWWPEKVRCNKRKKSGGCRETMKETTNEASASDSNVPVPVPPEDESSASPA